jgi:hypothetical protein
MATAMIYPEPEHGGSRKKGSSSETKLEFSKARLSQARTVLRASRPLAEAVLKGGVMTLDRRAAHHRPA